MASLPSSPSPAHTPSQFTPPSVVPSSVLIIGAGLAGLRSVGELRGHGFTGHITVVGAEDLPPYDRPPLSKGLLDREEPVWLTMDLGIDLEQADEVILGVAVESLTVEPPAEEPLTPNYSARLADGRVLEVDAVILACGSVPRVPGAWRDTMTLHSAGDAAALRAALQQASGGRPHLVCIGAGWIGSEISGLVAAAGFKVSVVEAAPSPLFTSLGPNAGSLMVPWFTDVELITGAMVTGVGGNRVTLDDGRVLDADVVVVAIGAEPATGWLGGSVAGQVAVLPDGSVDVDSHMRPVDPQGTPVPELAGVRAVGDCASRRSVRHGRVPGGHWDGALQTPVAAVASLLGQPAPEPAPDPAPYVFSTQFGRELALFGQPRPDDDVVLRGEPGTGADAPGWTALFFTRDEPGAPAQERELTAVLAVDRPRDVAAARRLFRQTHLPRLDSALASDPNVKLTGALIG